MRLLPPGELIDCPPRSVKAQLAARERWSPLLSGTRRLRAAPSAKQTLNVFEAGEDISNND
jgi:hypothetical protein